MNVNYCEKPKPVKPALEVKCTNSPTQMNTKRKKI